VILDTLPAHVEWYYFRFTNERVHAVHREKKREDDNDDDEDCSHCICGFAHQVQSPKNGKKRKFSQVLDKILGGFQIQ